MFVTKEHYLDADEIPDEILAHLMIVAKKIISVLKEIYKPDGYSIMQNGGMFNDVGHYHMHLFLRYKGDGFGLLSSDDKKEVNAEIAKNIRDRMLNCP